MQPIVVGRSRAAIRAEGQKFRHFRDREAMIQLGRDYLASPPESQSELGRMQYYLEGGLCEAYEVKHFLFWWVLFNFLSSLKGQIQFLYWTSGFIRFEFRPFKPTTGDVIDHLKWKTFSDKKWVLEMWAYLGK
jgi:hypothetical protein